MMDNYKEMLTYKNNSPYIRQDGMIDILHLCKMHGKKLDQWLKNKKSQEYIKALEEITGENAILYPEVKGCSVWGHPLIAINIAQWISPGFHRWCNLHIVSLITDGVTQSFVVKSLD